MHLSRARRIAILRTGSAEPQIRPEHGDYVDMVAALVPEALRDQVIVVDPAKNEWPEADSLMALLTTGSSSMVTDPSATDLEMFAWMRRVLATDLPVLGICYGHQMIAHLLGGEVGPLSGGPEIGTARIDVTASTEDPVFGQCPRQCDVAVIHWQTVQKLPLGAVSLAFGQRDPHHAVRFSERVWGVQFHPEFSPALMRRYTRECAADLRARGEDPEKAIAAVDSWSGDQTALVGRFVEWAQRLRA